MYSAADTIFPPMYFAPAGIVFVKNWRQQSLIETYVREIVTPATLVAKASPDQELAVAGCVEVKEPDLCVLGFIKAGTASGSRDAFKRLGRV